MPSCAGRNGAPRENERSGVLADPQSVENRGMAVARGDRVADPGRQVTAGRAEARKRDAPRDRRRMAVLAEIGRACLQARDGVHRSGSRARPDRHGIDKARLGRAGRHMPQPRPAACAVGGDGERFGKAGEPLPVARAGNARPPRRRAFATAARSTLGAQRAADWTRVRTSLHKEEAATGGL